LHNQEYHGQLSSTTFLNCDASDTWTGVKIVDGAIT